jgi:sRNA-binding carbon storage regulator CsrA
MIAGNIRVTVAAIDGRRVRLGITAPRSVAVARSELLAERCQSEAPGCPKTPNPTGDRQQRRSRRHET